MEHVVFFPAHDGSPAFRRVAGLEDAVRLVEHLRNVENVTEVSVHALTEVPLAFKAFYRVEMPGMPEAPSAPVAEAPVAAPVEAPAADAPAELHVEAPVAVLEPAVVPLVEAAAEAPDAAEVPEQPVPALASSNGHAPQASGPSSLGFFSR